MSYFNGTSREPLFIPNTQTGQLTPYYHQISQLGLEVQATLESWLLKLELAHQQGKLIENHLEMVAGLEYSFYGIANTDLDIGIISEYLWDERSESPNNFQNDLLIGLRFALNDEDSSEALIGVISDLDGDGEVLTLEASRRINNRLKISAEAVIWNGEDNPFDKEDYLQFELGYFF